MIFTNACILIVVFALLAQSLFLVQRVAQTRNVKGKVVVQRGGNGEFLVLAEGATVQNGDVVRTGAQSSAEFRWQDGTRWKLLQNSRFVIQKSVFNSLKKNEVSRLDLEEGQILVRVVKNLAPNSVFEVRTPSARVRVRGAVLLVSAQNGATDVNVFKGRADVDESNGSENENDKSEKASTFSAAQTQSAHISATGIHIESTKNQGEFLASPDFLRPALDVESRVLKSGATLIKGQTEVGNRLLIDGQSVPLLGNGVFLRRIDASAKMPIGGWEIESTDQFGATTSVLKSPVTLALAPVKAFLIAATCASQ